MHKIKFGLIHSTMFGLERMTRWDDQSCPTRQPIIINIASLVGLDPCHRLSIYSASKHAIVAFPKAYSVNSQSSESLVLHLQYIGNNNALFNSIAWKLLCGVKIVVLWPGATITNFGRQFADYMIVAYQNEALTFSRSTPKRRYTCNLSNINSSIYSFCIFFSNVTFSVQIVWLSISFDC